MNFRLSTGALGVALVTTHPVVALAAESRAVAVGPALTQTVVVLIGVCLLAAGALRWWAGRFGHTPVGSSMRVVARLPLEPRRALLVVRVADRTLLLASSESGIQSVGELNEAATQTLEREATPTSRRNVSRETSAVRP